VGETNSALRFDRHATHSKICSHSTDEIVFHQSKSHLGLRVAIAEVLFGGARFSEAAQWRTRRARLARKSAGDPLMVLA